MKTKPLILLTNDDGIDSPYLIAMAQSLQEQLDAEVLVIAPESQQSAMSHTITLHKPLRIAERNSSHYAVSGTPVDCVYIGVLKIASRKPDLVISGPNDGYNLGTDVFYSGTVGAAIEGGLRGIPSIAVSVDSHSPEAVPVATTLVCGLARELLKNKKEIPTILNVNVPAHCEGRLQWTTLGKRFYQDDVQERMDPRNRKYYWIGGGLAGIADIPGTDCKATIADGHASVTPLQLNLTASSVLEEQQSSWTIDGFRSE